MSNRQAYAPWPQVPPSTDSPHGHMMNHHMPPTSTNGQTATTSDATITPPPTASRSVTSSPPRAGMTPDQRDLKRQQNQVRRDSKTSARIRRANSNPYGSDIPAGPPSAGLNSVYPGSPAGGPPTGSMPILGENSAAPIHSPSYIQPYSPSMPEGQSHYQYQSPHMSSTYGLPMDYGFQQHPQSSYARGRHPPPPNMPMDPNTGMMYSPVPSMMSPGIPQPSPHGHSHAHAHGHPHAHAPHPHSVVPPSHMGAADSSHVRVVQTRPKPQCWEHGCNGRQFSTFSNLLRHQREKSGQAAKATCPNCGAEFTRTTARNGHLLHDKCKKRNPGAANANTNANNATSGAANGPNSAAPAPAPTAQAQQTV